MTAENQQAFDIVRKLFKDDYGNPFEMTPGQISIFRAIYEKQNPRIHVDCYTQYGKSDVVSMAVLLRATTFPEKWPIVGATKEKAGIIMEKLIKHVFENDYTLSKFDPGDDSLESIRLRKAKDHMSFKVDSKGGIGEVITLSSDARRKSQDAGDILIGHGAPNLVMDDAALIQDPIHGKALRMLGGHKDNFFLKITNSFGRNHAFRSRNDPKFMKIVIDYEQGIREGRITTEYIDEMRRELSPIMFDILYRCIYPPSGLVDDQGWMQLLTDEDIEQAQQRKVESTGYKRLGCDISEGVNANAFVLRTDNYAKIQGKTYEKDTMKTAEGIAAIRKDEHLIPSNISVDAVAIGAGVVHRLNELGVEVNAVKAGEKPTEKSEVDQKIDPIDFKNLRAEMYWNLAKWIRQGGALEPSPDWKQLTKIMYREAAGKKIEIMTKEEMHARGLLLQGESTDVPDALSLTFAPDRNITIYSQSASPALKPYYPELGI
jgi:hypothetical protein